MNSQLTMNAQLSRSTVYSIEDLDALPIGSVFSLGETWVATKISSLGTVGWRVTGEDDADVFYTSEMLFESDWPVFQPLIPHFECATLVETTGWEDENPSAGRKFRFFHPNGESFFGTLSLDTITGWGYEVEPPIEPAERIRDILERSETTDEAVEELMASSLFSGE